MPLPIRSFICWYANPDDAPSDEVMGRYDVVVGRACPPARRDAMRRLNPRVRFVVYVNAIDCYLPRGVADVEHMEGGRMRAEHGGTTHADDIFADHRDFLLRNRAGARGAPGGPRTTCAWGYHHPYDPTSRYANRFFLDPRSGWQDYYPELCARIMTAGNYDGVFCDNAGAHIEWTFENVADEMKADITDAEWARATAAMLSKVSRRVKVERPDALAFANTCGDFVLPDTDDIAPADFFRDAAIDGAMDEFFAYSATATRPEGVLPESKWREQLRSILCCEKMGRAYFAQSNGEETDHAGRIYALASFLIAAGDRSVFNYNPAPAASYYVVYRYPEWDIDLGAPLVQYESVDEALEVGHGKVYARAFERGLALVNPTAEAVTVDMPSGARRLVLAGGTLAHAGRVDWKPVTSPLTLAPRTAEILLTR